jgi:iron complex outermembrane receptor protein
MRGRSPFVMIDGVPQNTPLRDGSRSLRTASPETIERIEVVQGASALYGYGATGGAINIITKVPASGLEATTEVGLHGSAADVSESFTGRVHQSVSGRMGDIGVRGQRQLRELGAVLRRP